MKLTEKMHVSKNKVIIVVSASLGTAFAFYIGRIAYLKLKARYKERISYVGKFNYPVTRRCDHIDVYHGEPISDPFRWLESIEDEEVKAWVKAQNHCTDKYFSSNLDHLRTPFHRRMTSLYMYNKFECPMQYGDKYFFYERRGLENQSVLYKMSASHEQCKRDVDRSSIPLLDDIMQGHYKDMPEVLLDPNELFEDSTSLQGICLSGDGSKLAYTVSVSGSDWFSIHVMDVLTGIPLPDRITWCKFSTIAWNKDSTGFFYSSFPLPVGDEDVGDMYMGGELDILAGNKVFFHRLGTEAKDDLLVYSAGLENDKWLLSCYTSDDYETLMITIHETCAPVCRLYYLDLFNFDGKNESTLGRLVKLIDTFEHKYDYVTNEGRAFWFLTNQNAPKYKVVKIILPPVGSPMELDSAALAALPRVDAVPQDSMAVLEGAYGAADDRLLLLYMQDAHEHLYLCDLNGGDKQRINLPGIGSIDGISAHKSKDQVFFKFVNFQDAGTTYLSTITHNRDQTVSISTIIFQRTHVPNLHPEEFETNQIRYKSKDGTTVPMFIVSSKGQRGSSPCLLYGYGGFNISVTPTFSLSRLIFIKHFGGRVCIANIRGGGEYGEQWYRSGSGSFKQNTFDDFISAAKYLCTVNLTTPAQLAINGGSNGGLLVGTCINQQPELFAAAVSQVGVFDMLRFHHFTIGYAWCSDYGNSMQDVHQFKVLKSYSPVHNVSPDAGRYPATLLTTGDNDDRVVPLHSYKFIATLQTVIGSRRGEPNPLLIRIETNVGHGTGKPTNKVIEECCDIWAFIAHHTGATWRA